jgi:hypothetical protein
MDLNFGRILFNPVQMLCNKNRCSAVKVEDEKAGAQSHKWMT